MSPDDTKPASSRPADPALFYERHVFVCTNERPADHPRGCCKAKGSIELRDYMKSRARDLGIRRARINTAGCLDRCELGPSMVIYPEGVWYRPQNNADIDEILQTHLIEGGRVQRLMMQPTARSPKPPKKAG